MAKSKAEWVGRFKAEAALHLNSLKTHLQSLEDLPPSANLDEAQLEVVRELFRLAHTLRGSAGMVGQTTIAKLAEPLEQFWGQAYLSAIYLSTTQQNETKALLEQLGTELERLPSAP